MEVKDDWSRKAEKVYAIPSNRNCCWSVLEKDPLGEVNFDDGSRECTFDIRITSDDPGLEWNFDSVNVCFLKDNERTITLK